MRNGRRVTPRHRPQDPLSIVTARELGRQQYGHVGFDDEDVGGPEGGPEEEIAVPVHLMDCSHRGPRLRR